MKLNQRLTAAFLAAGLGASIASAPIAARASEEGRRNTTLALGAAAAALLLTQKNKLPGIVAAAGAAYAYKQYQDSVNDRRRWDRYGYYGDRYGNRYSRDRDRYDGSYYPARYDDRTYDSHSRDRYDNGYFGQESYHGKDQNGRSQNNPYRDSDGYDRYDPGSGGSYYAQRSSDRYSRRGR